jgi:hypothetical protein
MRCARHAADQLTTSGGNRNERVFLIFPSVAMADLDQAEKGIPSDPSFPPRRLPVSSIPTKC